MSLDPTKWTEYESLTNQAKERIETLYPYLKIEQAQFQEKESGVFLRHTNTGKVEKMLEPLRDPPPAAKTRTRAGK